MEFLHLILSAVLSLVILFLLTKIMGYRQLTQLSFFDYVNGITIGSIAAEMATNLELELWKPALAMVIYALTSIIISKLTIKSIKARRFFIGVPIVLINKGNIIEENLKKVNYDINDLLTDSRAAGYFDMSEIEFAVMENTGKISFLPKPENAPATAKDVNVINESKGLFANVIIDGKIMNEHLKNIGKDEIWLQKEVKKQNLNINEILLATVDSNDNLTAYKYTEPKDSLEIFM